MRPVLTALLTVTRLALGSGSCEFSIIDHTIHNFPSVRKATVLCFVIAYKCHGTPPMCVNLSLYGHCVSTAHTPESSSKDYNASGVTQSRAPERPQMKCLAWSKEKSILFAHVLPGKLTEKGHDGLAFAMAQLGGQSK